LQLLDNKAVVAFYVEFPSEEQQTEYTIDGQILANIINSSLTRIEQDIGKSLFSVTIYQYRRESITELPTTLVSPTAQTDRRWSYIIIGTSAGVFLLAIVILVAW